MSKAILLVGGGKGGVGKSLFSMAVVDFLGGTGREPFLVETDTSVPDVFKTYKGTIDGELVNLDEREGWIDLVNLVESRSDDTVVINTGARNQTGVTNAPPILMTIHCQMKNQPTNGWASRFATIASEASGAAALAPRPSMNCAKSCSRKISPRYF